MTTEAGRWITVARDCPAVTIPLGDAARLVEGQRVVVSQTLGGSVTVRTETGALLRIDGADSDALGLDVFERSGALFGSGPFDMNQVIEALQSVYDPEIPVSIVELGLVYRCEEQIGGDGRRRISIDMSMTAPGCGMGDVLRADAEKAVMAVAGVDEVDVALVWDPPWAIGRMSEAARLELGML